ncbi:MAG: glycosyl transferase family 2, partial [Bacteroidetes bacterium]
MPLKEQSWPEGTRPLLCTSTFCFQHETYVRQCIESILMQRTTFPVRVCIHDDASTDKTAEVIRSYQEAYPGKIWA